MNRLFSKWWLLVLFSSILAFLNVCKIEFFASWICLVPLFVISIDGNAKKSFRLGFVFGLFFSVFSFFWVMAGLQTFTGSSFVYGIVASVLLCAFLSTFYGLILFSFSLLKIKNESTAAVWINALLIASIFTVAEVLLTIVSEGFPWLAGYMGNGLAANILSIQPVAILGIPVLTFIVVFVNYLFAYTIKNRAWKRIYWPLGIIILYNLAGFFILNNFQEKVAPKQPFKTAIISENIPAEMKWDENTGDYLVKRLLDLNHSAVALNPDVILWSESAIPWTYKPDDDLLKEILKAGANKQITHILGINTEYKDNVVLNSAYAILPNGEVAGRYDKQYLLSVIEKPLNGFLMPFLSSAGFSVVNDVKHAEPLKTPFGNAGILICNEAAVPAAAQKMAKNNANFLCNMSNDGWFSNTYIVQLHFYCARLRAVATRKDVVVNSNNGYSGLIKASGEIDAMERSEDPFVKMVSVQPNNIISTATKFPNLFLYLCVFFVAGIFVYQIIKNRS